jgi:hypothetical protein
MEAARLLRSGKEALRNRDELVDEAWLDEELTILQSADIVIAVAPAWHQASEDITPSLWVYHHVADILVTIACDHGSVGPGIMQAVEFRVGRIRTGAGKNGRHDTAIGEKMFNLYRPSVDKASR